MISRTAALAVLFATTAAAQDRTMPPEAERQLARAIYKEMVEIKSGFTTGSTTPMSRLSKNDSIFTKMNPVPCSPIIRRIASR